MSAFRNFLFIVAAFICGLLASNVRAQGIPVQISSPNPHSTICDGDIYNYVCYPVIPYPTHTSDVPLANGYVSAAAFGRIKNQYSYRQIIVDDQGYVECAK